MRPKRHKNAIQLYFLGISVIRRMKTKTKETKCQEEKAQHTNKANMQKSKFPQENEIYKQKINKKTKF